MLDSLSGEIMCSSERHRIGVGEQVLRAIRRSVEACEAAQQGGA